jgi:hypothetical protein
VVLAAEGVVLAELEALVQVEEEEGLMARAAMQRLVLQVAAAHWRRVTAVAGDWRQVACMVVMVKVGHGFRTGEALMLTLALAVALALAPVDC